MHQCLRTAEIASMICNHLRDSNSLSALAALTVTCRALETPALDALWFEQDNLYNLMQCLPSDLWTCQFTSNSNNPDIRLIRNILPTDLPRMFTYADRIRQFDFCDALGLGYSLPRIDVDPSSLQVLCSSINRPLLPNLKHLTWTPYGNAIFQILPFLCGPKLEALKVSMDGNDVVRFSHLLCLKKCPSLVSLTISRDSDGGPEFTRALLSVVPDMMGIERLQLPAVGSDVLAAVASLPALRHLVLGSLESNFSAPRAPVGGFPALSSFGVFVADNASAANAIKFIGRSSPAERLTINITSLPRSDTYAAVFQALLDNIEPARLKSLDIDLWPDPPLSSPSQILQHLVPSSALELLLPFSNLVNLKLKTPGFQLDDSLLSRMANAWPRLQSLQIIERGFDNFLAPAVTLAGLLSIAQHCQQIHTLAINFNSVGIDPVAHRRPGGGITNTSLKFFNVGNSPLNDAVLAAVFLSDVFPGLDTIKHADNRAWTEATRLMQVLLAVRRQEQISRREFPVLRKLGN